MSDPRLEEAERGSGLATVEPAVVRAAAAQRATDSEEVATSKPDQPDAKVGVTEDIFRLAAASEQQASRAAGHQVEVEASSASTSATERVAAAGQARTPAAKQGKDDVVIELGDRRWRIRGLGIKPTVGQLRVNVLVSRGEAFHVDALELYSARQRAAYTSQAATELGVEERVLKRDLGHVLLKLEELVDERQRAAEAQEKRPELGDKETAEALGLLRSPRLIERILEDFEQSGVVGEETNKLVGYLAATSRKLEDPLAIVIQSASAAGKSLLMEAVLSLMPDEERVQYSAMTGCSTRR